MKLTLYYRHDRIYPPERVHAIFASRRAAEEAGALLLTCLLIWSFM
jgi:hypothetical protein